MTSPSTLEVETSSPWRRLRSHAPVLPGLAVVAMAGLLATAAASAFPAASALTVAMILGIACMNLGLDRPLLEPGLRVATRPLLRLGVVLLGLQLALPDVLALGIPTLTVVVGVVAVTFVGTRWLGVRLGLTPRLSLLIATGFSICGAAAIVAMDDATDSDQDDVVTAIALVTVFGTAAIFVLPLLQQPLGLSSSTFGAWAGASVHEVAQVVATASTAGPSALSTAVVVKLSRVVLLAPLITLVCLSMRRSGGEGVRGRTGPLVPVFVLGFAAAVAVRSTGIISPHVLGTTKQITNLILACALFGLGTTVKLRTLMTGGARAMVLGTCSTLLICTASYAGLLLAS